MTGAEGAELGFPSSRILVFAVIVAAVVRIAWAYRYGLTLEQEGVEYVRIAENLLSGHGYVGIFDNGTQLNFPPLYPLMIAALSLVTGSGELAARAICVAFGAALVVPMFKIAERAYDQRAAIAVAALVVFHPLLIAASASTYSEGPYLTLMMFAVLCLTHWVDNRRVTAATGAGIFIGLAYLIRPEAFLFAGVCVMGGLVLGLYVRERRATWTGALVIGGVFAIVAAPNVAFLSISTGQFRIEAKGTLAYQWGQKMNQGMSYFESSNAIGADLSDQGVFMRSNLDVIKSTKFSASEYVAYMMTAAKRNVIPIIMTITKSGTLGFPALLLLVALGLFRSPWGRHRAAIEILMISAASMFVVVLFSLQALWLRYFIPIAAVLPFWAGIGAEELRLWGRDTLAGITGRPAIGRICGEALKWVSILAVLLIALRAVHGEGQFKESQNWERRDAGRWLAQQEPRPKWVMDLGLQVPYYAGANLIYFPYADPNLALAYIAKRKPDYIVMKGEDFESLPATAAWFQQGIPDKRAVLVYDRGDAPAERIKIYRWVDDATKVSR